MRLAPSIVALPLFAALSSACAPPKPSEPETTAVYDKPPAAAPAPVKRLSVNEPEGEMLDAGPGADASVPAAPPTAPAASPAPPEPAPAAAPPAATAPPAAAPPAAAPPAAAPPAKPATPAAAPPTKP